MNSRFLCSGVFGLSLAVAGQGMELLSYLPENLPARPGTAAAPPRLLEAAAQTAPDTLLPDARMGALDAMVPLEADYVARPPAPHALPPLVGDNFHVSGLIGDHMTPVIHPHSPIPEPADVAVYLGAFALGLSFYRRRRSRAGRV